MVVCFVRRSRKQSLKLDTRERKSFEMHIYSRLHKLLLKVVTRMGDAEGGAT